MSFRTGDRVYVSPDYPGVPRSVLGRAFVVTRVNPVNVRCRSEEPGQGINYPKDSLVALGADEAPPVGATRAAIVPLQAWYQQGEIITATTRYAAKDEPLIVIRDNGETVSAVRLGGDGGRYLRLAKNALVKRDRAWLTETLVGAL